MMIAGFQSDRIVRRNFQSLLFVHLMRAKDLPQESNFIDRIFQGSQPDPYAIVDVTSTHGLDRAITKAAVSPPSYT